MLHSNFAKDKKTPVHPLAGPQIRVVDAELFLEMELPPRGCILGPWLPLQGLAMVYAPRGVGKTFFSLNVACAVALGKSFLGWSVSHPRKVLFIDGEMPGNELQKRLRTIAKNDYAKLGRNLQIYTPDLQEGGMIDLCRPDHQAALEPHLQGVSLIIVDNISTLCRSGNEAEGDSWASTQEWALRQRAEGRSVLFIHHAGKSGQQRGTSRREDVLDTVIALRLPNDYTPEKGACFEVHFEKARGFHGQDAKPFEAKMTIAADVQEWSTRTIEESTAEKVANLLNDGMAQHEIAEELGITKGAVSKAKKRAAQLGLLKSK